MIDIDEIERKAKRRAAARGLAAPDPEWFEATAEYLDATAEQAVLELVAELREHRTIVARLRAHDERRADTLAKLDAELEALTAARNADRSEWMTTYAKMRAEIEALRCGDLGAFFDGELPPARADAFRLHLGTCSKCEAGLHGLMQERVVTEPTRKR